MKPMPSRWQWSRTDSARRFERLYTFWTVAIGVIAVAAWTSGTETSESPPAVG